MTSIAPNSETSVFIADLSPEVKEFDLVELFKSIGKIVDQGILIKSEQISITKLQISAIVTFSTSKQAQGAVKLNGYLLHGKTIRISAYQNPKEFDQQANIFVSKMDPTLTQKDLTQYFSNFGKICSVKINVDSNSGVSKGYGYVQFVNKEDAEKCLKCVETHQVGLTKELTVSQFIPITERDVREKQNLIIKGLPEQMSIQNIKIAIDKFFSEVGEIESSVVKKDQLNKEIIAYVCYQNTENAEKAIATFNGFPHFSHQRPLIVEYEHPQTQRFINHETNLYIKGIKGTITETVIQKAFEQFGEIINMKLEKPANKETQFAFINFSTKEEALRTLKDAASEQSVQELFLDNKVFITPHMNQQNRMILNKVKQSGQNNLFVQSPPFFNSNVPVMFPMFYPNPHMMMPNNFYPQPNFNSNNNNSNGAPKSHRNNYNNNNNYNNRAENRNNNSYRNGNGNRNHNNNYNSNYNNNNNNSYNNRYPYQKKNQTENHISKANGTDPELERLRMEITTPEGKSIVKNQFGLKFFNIVKEKSSQAKAPQITGMLIDIDNLGIEQIYEMSLDRKKLESQIEQALAIINSQKDQSD